MCEKICYPERPSNRSAIGTSLRSVPSHQWDRHS